MDLININFNARQIKAKKFGLKFQMQKHIHLPN